MYILVILKTCFKGSKNKMPVFPWMSVSRLDFLLSGKDPGILLQLLPALKATLVSFSSKFSPNRTVHKGAPFSSVQIEGPLQPLLFTNHGRARYYWGHSTQPSPRVHIFKSNSAGGGQKLIDTHPMRLTLLSSIRYLALNPTELDPTHRF